MTRTIRRRRLEAKTDYKTRLDLLASGKTRVVIRKTNRYIIIQLVSSLNAQDKVIFSTTSKVLLSKGWPKEKSGSLKSLQAAYLTGHIFGASIKNKIKECILDLGMQRNVKNSRVYASLKGIVESGLKIPHSSSILPPDDLIEANKSTLSIYKKIKQSP